MDTGHWPQEMVMIPTTTTTTTTTRARLTEERSKPQKEQAFHCPRCNSTNTKFCYYNNYSLTQPRYFCKTCRRYWTEGGSLRNVPVGGGSRKNKKPSSSSTSTSKKPSSGHLDSRAHIPKLHEGNTQDLNLAFPHHSLNPHEFNNNFNFTNLEYVTGFGLQEMRPPGISFDGGGNADGCTTTTSTTTTTGLFFPFDGFKQVGPSSSGTPESQQNRGQGGDTHTVFWNGVIGGGGGGPW
ncbi:uncharacterized protein [Typha angustifolia]|uniref:uncharacterized protein n=1 Tax=Typha angustifolia TaxID=59011 RepID=UPI003C2BFFFF